MTHMHVAGSVHADVAAAGPQWLTLPDDVNALDPALWSASTDRDDDGIVEVAGVTITELLSQYGSPLYVLDESDFRQRARTFRDAFSEWDVYYAGKAFFDPHDCLMD